MDVLSALRSEDDLRREEGVRSMWKEVKIIIAATITFSFMVMHGMNKDYQTMTLVMTIFLAGWIASGKE